MVVCFDFFFQIFFLLSKLIRPVNKFYFLFSFPSNRLLRGTFLLSKLMEMGVTLQCKVSFCSLSKSIQKKLTGLFRAREYAI